MTRKLSFILMLLASLFLSGCHYQEAIDDLQSQINDLKAGEIASVKTQLANIQTTLGDLQHVDTELKDYLKTLQENMAALDGENDERYEKMLKSLSTLEAADDALGQRITDLKTYCTDQDIAVRDWATTTFATLEQHNAVLAEIATIKIRLAELDSAMSNLNANLSQKISDAEGRVMAAIGSSESSIKSWVNSQLAGYYTIAQADAKLKALEDALKDADEDLNVADEALAGDIEKLRQELEKARADLTSAYQTAIAEAINNNNGVINAKIAEEIKTATDNLQAQIDAITDRLDKQEARIKALETCMAEWIGMVQSIVVVPDYSDGSAKISGGKSNIIRFEVYPLDTAKKLAETGPTAFSLDFVETETKSSIFQNIPITGVSFDGEILSIKADGSSLPDGIKNGTQTASARLRISNDVVTRCSEYFPLYNPYIPVMVDLGLSVKWASFNLGASKPEEYGDYYAWGETEPYYESLDPLIWKEGKNSGYNWASYKWCNGSYDTLTKYNIMSDLGTVDNKTVLEMEDDAAHMNLGSNWRLPTITEWMELMWNCNREWTTLNGIYGMKISGKKEGYTDKWIFLPAAGHFYSTTRNLMPSMGYCLCSSLSNLGSNQATSGTFDSTGYGRATVHRCYGYTVRPVMDRNGSGEEMPAGTVVFEDDFEWMEPWTSTWGAGDDVTANYVNTSTNPNVYANADPLADFISEFNARGYGFIWGWAGQDWSDGDPDDGNKRTLYLQRNYFKFGKTDYNSGIILPVLNALKGSADIMVSFDWCYCMTGARKPDYTTLTLVADGSGVFDATNTNISEELVSGQEVDEEGYTSLAWQHAEVRLNGANAHTRITIRPTYNDPSITNPYRGQNRWYLDNIKIVTK